MSIYTYILAMALTTYLIRMLPLPIPASIYGLRSEEHTSELQSL